MRYRVKQINSYYHSYFIAQWSWLGLFWHTIEYGSPALEPKEYYFDTEAEAVIDHDIKWRKSFKSIVILEKKV